MGDLVISEATKRNWKRLNVTEDEMAKKLSHRANKLKSLKKIIPREYFKDKKNIKKIIPILELKIEIEPLIFNLGINLLYKNGLVSFNPEIVSENEHIMAHLKNFGNYELNDYLINYDLPPENDILGIVYQSLMSEGNKNKKGSYYTPDDVVSRFLPLIKSDTKLLDPCCGTGSFLLTLGDRIENPENIYGFDSDKVACFIAGVNLLIKYKDKEFYPNIFNCDFLKYETDMRFDLIATNPPWGGVNVEDYSKIYPEIKSGENFSYFIVKSERVLKEDGRCCFVLPVSITNVKTHRDIRRFILDNFRIENITHYGKVFTGVLSDVVSMTLAKRNISDNIVDIFTKQKLRIPQTVFLNNENYNFTLMGGADKEFLDKIYSVPHTTLKDSVWALGIVTGNNEKHISDNPTGREKIFTGKNISPYLISETDKYINYDRTKFQQVAPDEIYRAKEKLVYKFISKSPVFAYDDEQRLFLNSANILIPKVETHSVKTALAFLNSSLFRYIYKTKFGEVKILKGNLLDLPFPYLDEKTKTELEKYVDNYIKTNNKTCLTKIDEIIYHLFDINDLSLIQA